MSKTGRDKIVEPVGEVRLKPCLGGENGSCVICGARSETVLTVDGGAEVPRAPLARIEQASLGSWACGCSPKDNGEQ